MLAACQTKLGRIWVKINLRLQTENPSRPRAQTSTQQHLCSPVRRFGTVLKELCTTDILATRQTWNTSVKKYRKAADRRATSCSMYEEKEKISSPTLCELAVMCQTSDWLLRFFYLFLKTLDNTHIPTCLLPGSHRSSDYFLILKTTFLLSFFILCVNLALRYEKEIRFLHISISISLSC